MTKTSYTSCPITIDDIRIQDVVSIGNNVYLWDSDLNEDQEISVRVRVYRTAAFIEGFSIRNKAKLLN